MCPTGMQNELTSCMARSTLELSKQIHDQSKYKWNLCTSVSHISHYLAPCSLFQSCVFSRQCFSNISLYVNPIESLLETDFSAPPPELLIQQFGSEAQECAFLSQAYAAGPSTALGVTRSQTRHRHLQCHSAFLFSHQNTPQPWNKIISSFLIYSVNSMAIL